MLFSSRSPDSQLSDKWEILPEQIEFEEELGRGAFGVVYKATFRQRVEMEVLDTETSKRPLLSTKKAPQVVAVKVLHGKNTVVFIKKKPLILQLISSSLYATEMISFFLSTILDLRPQNSANMSTKTKVKDKRP